MREGFVNTVCPHCDAALVVFPPAMLPKVGETTGMLEAEFNLAEALAAYKGDPEGKRFVVADALESFTCPACGERASLRL